MQQNTNKENRRLNTSVGFKSVVELLDATDKLDPKRLKQKVASAAKEKKKVPCSGLSQKQGGEEDAEKRITLKDLCPEEKQTIGDLMKNLAQEKKEKEDIVRKFDKERKELRDSIKVISKNHQVCTKKRDVE